MFHFNVLRVRRGACACLGLEGEGYLTNFDGDAIVADQGDLNVLGHLEYDGVVRMKKV